MRTCLKAFCLFICFILSTTLVSACQPTPAPVVTLPPSTEESKTVTVSTPVSATLPAKETPSAEATVPVPEKYELREAKFDIITKEELGDLTVYVGSGSVTNDMGQTLLITVTGSSETSVTDYLKTTKFYFEIREPMEFLVKDEIPVDLPKLSVQELLRDANVENLRIDFDLSTDTKIEYPKGSVLLIIDPTVKQNQYNNYAAKNPITDKALVTVSVSQGKVEGRLYLECACIQSKTASVSYPKTLSGVGSGYFDLTIKGLNTGNNTYNLVGTWNYGYTTAVTSEAVSKIECP